MHGDRAGCLGTLVLIPIVTIALAGGASSETENPSIPDVLTLAWCLERGQDANPRLEGARADAEAAFHRIEPSGALDDLRVSYDASNIPTGDVGFSSTPLSGHQFGIRQKIPFPGLLSTREQAARHTSEASSLLVDDEQLVTSSAVEIAWTELVFAEQAVGITTRNIALLRQLSATAESRYRVGSGLQQDVLRAQVELTVLLQERLRREEAIESAASALIELLDLPGGIVLPPTDQLGVISIKPELEPLLARLDETNARLRAAAQRVYEAEAKVRVVELQGMPDFDLGLGYRLRSRVSGDPVDGDDFFSAGITMRLPVDRSKWRAKVAEQNARVRRAKAEFRALRSSLVARSRRTHASLTRAFAEESLLSTGLVPQAAQSLEASRSAYEVGRIEFLSLLDSQVRLLDAELRLARARADKRIAFASLELATGAGLR